MGTRPFTDTLTALRYGELHDELSEQLNELVAACVSTGRAGSLTLTLKLKPSRQTIEITDDVKVKKPQPERGMTLMFPTPENNLAREDPRQGKLEGLRDVSAERPSELRKVEG